MVKKKVTKTNKKSMSKNDKDKLKVLKEVKEESYFVKILDPDFYKKYSLLSLKEILSNILEYHNIEEIRREKLEKIN